MIIYKSDNTPIIRLDVDDTSYCYREIMGDCKVYLEFALTQHVELPIGSYVNFQGEKYSLMSVADVTIQHSRDYEYKVTFEGPQARFSKYRVHNPVDGRLIFEMTAHPSELLALIIANLNEREGSSVWSAGACVTDTEKSVSFNHTKLSDALTMIANAFDTEWEVVGHTISLNKVEYNSSSPLALGYGRNQGFKPGIGRTNYGETGMIERLYVQGGDRNISLAEYGSSVLLLPKGFSFQFDGEKFKYTIDGTTYTETGFDSDKAVAMATDANGFSVALASAGAACNEESLDLTDIYPKRVGTVTDVRFLYNHQYLTYAELMALDEPPTGDDWLEVQVDIIDANIPASLDYSECLLANDQPLTVIFQSGMLAGREFSATFRKAARNAVVTDPETGVDTEVVQRPANRFELERANIDGVEMPNNTYRPNAAQNSHDSYIVVNCYMPDAYICDKATFSGAEMEMLRKAAKFLYRNKDIQLTFKGEVDDLYSKRNWTTVGGKLKLGGCVSFTHAQVQATPLVTRIVAVKQFINNPYSPEITLSNEAVKGGLSSRLATLGGDKAHVLNQAYAIDRMSRRSWRDAKETMSALAGALLEGFTEGISPITVQTMQMLVGDESLQFRYVNSKTTPQPVPAGISYNPATKKLVCNANIIQHMTLGIDTLSNSHAATEYKYWDIDAFESPYLGDALAEKKFYLYAKCNKAAQGETGYQVAEYVLSETAIAMNSVTGYWHLLVGILNSEFDDDRSFVTLFGFTEILPGRVTTDKVVSSSGTTFWDLVQNVLQLGENFRYDPTNGLVLKGALVQTGSGDNVVIGAWCGQYDANRIYQLGDEVWWQAADGTISTYRYINSTADKGHDPSNTNYWQFVAKGVVGQSGSFKSTAFIRTNDDLTNETPTGGTYASPIPTSTHTDTASSTQLSWQDGIPNGEAKLWASHCTFHADGTSSGWSAPRPMTDTSTFDIEFAYKQTGDAAPATPTDNNRHKEESPYGYSGQVWFDPDKDKYSASGVLRDWTGVYWRAERECINGAWTGWTIVRIKGEKGDTPLTADITNEVDGVAVGSDGVLDVAVSLDTGVMLYFGTDAETLTAITPSVPSAFSSKIHLTPTLATGAIAVVIDANTDFSSVSKVDIPIEVTSAKGSRTVTYTIIPVKEGEDGAVYKLHPSVDVVKGTWSGNTVSYTPTSVTCQRMARAGSGAFAASSLGTLKYSVDGGSTESNYPSSGSVAVSNATSAGRIIFYWYIGGVLVDRETVPIVTNGKNGTDGDDGDDGNGIASISEEYAQSLNGSTPPSSWSSTKPAPQAGYFLWTKTTITFTVSSTPYVTYSAVYCATNGTNGTNGTPGPSSPYRGEYDANEVYYGTLNRRDIVYYVDPVTGVGKWYQALYNGTDRTFSDKTPSNTEYWSDFGSNFSNIATGFAFIANLVVQRLNTAGEGASTRRIVAEGNELVMYDDNDNPKLRITGDDLSAFPSSTNETFSAFNYGVSQSGQSYAGGGHYEGESNGVTFSVQSGASVKLPAMTVSLEGGLTETYEGNQMGFLFFNFGWMIDGRKMGSKQVSGWFGKNGNSTVGHFWTQANLDAITVNLAAGNHTVKIWCEADMGGCLDAAGLAWNLYMYNSSNASLAISYAVQKTEIGANGFQVAFGSDRMLKCVISGTTTTFLMQSDNAGIEVSSTGSGTGTLRIRIGGTWYYAKRKSDGTLELSTTA